MIERSGRKDCENVPEPGRTFDSIFRRLLHSVQPVVVTVMEDVCSFSDETLAVASAEAAMPPVMTATSRLAMA